MTSSDWAPILQSTKLPKAAKTASLALAPCEQLGILAIRGDKAVAFLQGQCTCDVESLAPGETALGAICTLQGKVVTNFVLLKQTEQLLLRMSADLIQPTIDYLHKYAVFFRVEMNALPNPCVLGIISSDSKEAQQSKLFEVALSSYQVRFNTAKEGQPQEFNELWVMPEQQETVAQLLNDIAQNSALGIQLAPEALWHNHLLSSGQVIINAQTSQRFLPHALNLDKFGAISFNKGCYTGQEIVARTEYRGQPKRRVQLIKTKINANASPPGIECAELPMDILDSESKRAIGQLVVAEWSTDTDKPDQQLLALMPVDSEESGQFICNDTVYEYSKPGT